MVRHLPAATTTDRTPIHDDEADWSTRDTGHYSRKRIDLPADWGLEDDDATHYLVECFYDHESGGRINVWEDTESSLDHVWRPATHDGDDYRQVGEIHFWDWENAHDEYARLDDADDVTDLMWRNR